MSPILLVVLTIIVTAAATWVVVHFVLNGRSQKILKDAEAEAEVLKKNKLLEAKEQFVSMKSEYEKEVASRNSKMQQAEVRIQQREMTLNQKQGELQRKNTEADAIKENLESQIDLVEKKKKET
jgi:Domain of unknown function (DUF3552).